MTSKETDRKVVSVQFIGNLGVLVVGIGQNLLLVPLYIRFLGAEMYGGWLTVGSVALTFGIADLGMLSGFVTQRVASAWGEEDVEAVGQIMGSSLAIALIPVVVVLAGGFALSELVPEWVSGLSAAAEKELAAAFRVAIIGVTLTLVMNVTASFLVGLQRPIVHYSAFLTGGILSLVLTAVLLFKGWGVMAIPLGSLVRSVVTIVADSVASARLAKAVGISSLRPSRKYMKDLLGASSWLGGAKISETLTLQLDNIIVGRVLGPTSVTVLSVTRKVLELGAQVLLRLGASFFPVIAHAHGTARKSRLRRLLRDFWTTLVIVGIFGFGSVTLLNSDFIRLWVGSELDGGQTLLMLLVVLVGIRVCRGGLHNILFAQNRIRVTAMAWVVEALAHGGFGFLLAAHFGLEGLVAAAIVAGGLGVTVRILGRGEAMFLGGFAPAHAIGWAGLGTLPAILVGWLIQSSGFTQSWWGFGTTAVVMSLIFGGFLFLLMRHGWGSVSFWRGRGVWAATGAPELRSANTRQPDKLATLLRPFLK